MVSTTVILPSMTRSVSILGPWFLPYRVVKCALSGSSPVCRPSFLRECWPPAKLVITGHDTLMDERTNPLLMHDSQFNADVNRLLMDNSVPIPLEQNSYHRLVASSAACFDYHPCMFRIPDLLVDDIWSLIYYAGYVTRVVCFPYTCFHVS